jgi:hypothetical protein
VFIQARLPGMTAKPSVRVSQHGNYRIASESHRVAARIEMPITATWQSVSRKEPIQGGRTPMPFQFALLTRLDELCLGTSFRQAGGAISSLLSCRPRFVYSQTEARQCLLRALPGGCTSSRRRSWDSLSCVCWAQRAARSPRSFGSGIVGSWQNSTQISVWQPSRNTFGDSRRGFKDESQRKTGVTKR